MNERTKGWMNGFIGVLIFSGSLPATRLAVMDFDPFFLTVSRAAISGILAGILLLIFRQQKPVKSDVVPLLLIALCVVVGFPLLTASALQYVTSAHAIIYLGLLPLSTAIFGVLRGSERPQLVFWIFSSLGSCFVVGFAVFNEATSSPIGDSLMFVSIILCGYGYAEGARLTQRLGGWQVISWTLVLSLPASIFLTLYTMPESWSNISISAIVSLAYVSLFSMFLGFVFWYRGLAQGGIAAVGQLQLLQPFFGLLLSALILHESIGWPIFVLNTGVALCVAFARRFAAN
ncbi:DMT family transporter [Paenibacillus lautus]|uniref:DMT family transporter n=1 Tax=Paenibacillus lautus TaxID=1401 RepID=UPI003D266E48